MPRLVEKNISGLSVSGSGTLYYPVTVYYQKYDLRTLSATSSDAKITIKIYDNEKETSGARLVYQSLSGTTIDDICNIPIQDKSGYSTLHLYIYNDEGASTTVDCNLKVTNLL